MKKYFLILFIAAMLVGLVACQDNSISSLENHHATATALEMTKRLPDDIPLMDGAYDLRISSSGSSITYRVQAPFEDVIQFYQDQAAAMGWEQLGGEQVMMDSITMQRQKPDKNMSILISAVQDSDEVLVRVMVASK
jgi:hypothetical protein